jgi:GTPase SAR1 family protein
MGLCQSEEEKKQVKNSKNIDKKIRETAETEDKMIKLLLLGAGECGKSTLMKQMRQETGGDLRRF